MVIKEVVNHLRDKLSLEMVSSLWKITNYLYSNHGVFKIDLKEACKKYHAVTAERLPKVLGILKWHFMYNETIERFSFLILEILKLNYVA